MENLREALKWSALDIKQKIAYITAVSAFVIGWGLTIAGFIIGAGVISDSVLWVLGQSLVYAASVFGVGMYVGGEIRSMKRNIRRFIRDEERIVHDDYGQYGQYGQEEEIEETEDDN